MKLRLLTLFVFFITGVHSQEPDNSLRFYSISFSPLNAYTSSSSEGIALSLDLNLKKGNTLIKVFALTGSESDISGFAESDISENFYEMDILLGNEIEAKSWLYIDYFAGLGLKDLITNTPEKIPGSGHPAGSGIFSYTQYEYRDNKSHNVKLALALQSNLRFKTGKRFSLGLQLHTNITTSNTMISYGLLFRWKLGSASRL